MAECSREDGGKGEKIAKCPMCERRFETWKTAGEHLKKYHEGMPGWKEALRSLPKDVCQYCGKEQSQLYRHEKTCKDSGKNEREEDCVLKNMDASVPEVFLGSKLVRDTLAEFEGGNFSKMSDAQAFLALVVHLRNVELGVGVVRNLTLSELKGAVREEDDGWRRIRQLQVTQQELQVIKEFTFKYGLTNNPAFKPFADASLERMRNVLKKAITSVNPGLLNSGSKPPRKDTGPKPGKSAAKDKAAAGVSGDHSREVFTLAASARCAVSSGVDIVDEDLFFGEFRDWLYAGGYNVKGTEEMVAKMEVFKEYQAPGFSFVRLSKLYEASAADLLPLPSCKEDWLCSFTDIDTACCAYTLLLGFLRHLLKDHGDCGHITREESRRRLGHLEKMSREYSQVFHRARRT